MDTGKTKKELQQKCQQIVATEKDPVEKFRYKLLTRGPGGIRAISKQFRIHDYNGNGTISRKELQVIAKNLGIKLSELEINMAFDKFDKDGNDTIDYEEFLQGMRLPMSDGRKECVSKAFKTMDKTGDGVITVDDLKGTYRVEYHPKFLNGEYTADEVFQEFLDSFQVGSDTKDEEVTKEEFMDYFLGVSASIDKDAYFQLMMERAWKI